MKVYLKIKDSFRSWEEEYLLEDNMLMKETEEYFKELVQSFNKNIQLGESPREYLGFRIKKYDESMDDTSLIKEFINLKEKQLQILTRASLDEFKGETAKDYIKLIKKQKSFKLLLDVVLNIEYDLKLDDFVTILNIIVKRDWKSITSKLKTYRPDYFRRLNMMIKGKKG